jgi:integrase
MRKRRREYGLFIEAEITPSQISLKERERDNARLLDQFDLSNHARNFSDMTKENLSKFIRGILNGIRVVDPAHPDGIRLLFSWELVRVGRGKQIILKLNEAFKDAGLKLSTRHGYSKAIKYFCDFLLHNPSIPGSNGETIISKYGAIEQPVTRHTAPARGPDDDASETERFILTREQREAFLNFIINTYVDGNRKKVGAVRDFVMILVAIFTGLRISEIRHLRARGPNLDLDYENGMLRTHWGKGTKCKGKRTRWTILPLRIHSLLKMYQEKVLPMFSKDGLKDELFLSEQGKILTYKACWRNFRQIVNEARSAGVDLPEKLRWHDLRRTFATLFLEENPDQFWTLMEYLGHIFNTTMARYLVVSDEMRRQTTRAMHARRIKSQSQRAETIS